jgi:hypothetical protein
MSSANGALLEGKTLAADYLTNAGGGAPITISSNPFIVGPQVELIDFGGHDGVPPFLPPQFDVDVADTSVLVTLVNDLPSSSTAILRLVDVLLDINQFSGESINPETSLPGFTASRARAFGNTITFTLSNLSGVAGQVISINVRAIPEPATSVLGATAIVIGLARSRRVGRAS